jgi:hypothetical protein
MDDFSKLTSDTLNNYFKSLTKTGYLKDTIVNKVFLLVFINHILKDYSEFIAEEYYNMLDRIVTCIQSNSCLTPYNKILLASKPIKK